MPEMYVRYDDGHGEFSYLIEYEYTPGYFGGSRPREQEEIEVFSCVRITDDREEAVSDWEEWIDTDPIRAQIRANERIRKLDVEQDRAREIDDERRVIRDGTF